MFEDEKEAVKDSEKGFAEARAEYAKAQADLIREFLEKQARITVTREHEVASQIRDLSKFKEAVATAIDSSAVSFERFLIAQPSSVLRDRFRRGSGKGQITVPEMREHFLPFAQLFVRFGFKSQSGRARHNDRANEILWEFYQDSDISFFSPGAAAPQPESKGLLSAIDALESAKRDLIRVQSDHSSTVQQDRWDSA